MRLRGKLIQTLGSDSRGAVAVVFALSATVLIGFAGLGAEIALWYIAKRTAQGAADTAAYSAAVAYHAGDTANFAATAKAVAAQYGFVQDNRGSSVVVNRPPRSGPNRADHNAIEVIVNAPQHPMFSALFAAAPTVVGRAVALTGNFGGSNRCVVTLANGTTMTIVGRTNLAWACGAAGTIRVVE